MRGHKRIQEVTGGNSWLKPATSRYRDYWQGTWYSLMKLLTKQFNLYVFLNFFLRPGLKHKAYSTYSTEDNRGSWLMKVLVQSFCGI